MDPERLASELAASAREAQSLDLSSLNAPQREAVEHAEGPLVVFAGAGSGKTRVITYRIGRLLLEDGVKPWEILAVTFTNKAAGEMRERLRDRSCPFSIKGLQVGTFHSMCARMLRRHHEGFGVKRDFTIYDDQDQRSMIKRIMSDLNLDPKRLPPKSIAGTINRAKQEVVGPDEFATEGDPYREIVGRVYQEYEEKMRKANALDFGDLIYRTVIGLEQNETLRHQLAGGFVHTLVDEFQDTNHAQLRLVRALASVHRNLCVVGDDDQSIYRWRGADRRNILDFRDAYPDAKVVKLEQNYRSSQRILRVAHAVIRRNLDREPKEMWTENPEGQKVLVVRCLDERDEARMVVRGVEELRAKGEPLTEIVVFYRTHAQSRVIEEGLRQANVPYRVVGGVRFYDRTEVKDLLAYLRVLNNPADDVSLLRVINTPTRGIGKTTIGRLLDAASEHGVGVWDIISEVEDHDRFKTGTRKKIVGFRELIHKLMDEAKRLPLDEIGGAVLQDTGYVQTLKNENSPEADSRIGNLEELVGSMQQFADEHPEAGLSEFLEEVTLATDQDADEVHEKVTLMTVHAAKGLEFDTVMVTGLEEGMFPMRGTDPGEDPEEMEEERRLAYVALTRARQTLILSFARERRIYGQSRWGDASRFLHEIPKDDAHWIGIDPPKPMSAPRYRPDPWDAMPKQETPRPLRDPTESYVDYSEGSDLEGFHRGMKVRHRKFGVGEIRSVETSGMVPKASVLFAGGITKTLSLEYLEPVI